MHFSEIFFAVVVLIAIINGVDTRSGLFRLIKAKNFYRKTNVCQNGGTFLKSGKSWGHWKCKCPDGFSGRRCEERTPEAEQCVADYCTSSPCQNGGKCTSSATTFSCQCAHGYKGKTCGVTDHCASSPCKHGGICTSCSTTFSCQCVDGYEGNTYEVTDHCVSSPCQHGGNCTSGSTTYSCQCADGYKGSKCEVIDHCASSPCKHGGNCTSGETTFSCQCAYGYRGSKCEDTDYCASSPCQNGGNCTSGQTTFVCKCKDGFVGYTCDVKSCMEILQSNTSLVGQDGIYQISVGGHERMVYCDMTTDGGGWTAIQRRQDGSTDFNQTWDNYKNGFGEPPKDYWIGNDIINILTNTDNYELRVDITSFVDKTAYALYSTFRIGNESSKYIITVSGYTGTAGDGLRNKSGKLFSTYDNDNDRDDNRNCGAENYGGWWYSYCITSNLNGKFANRLQFGYHYAVWTPWTQNVAMPYRDDAALKKTMMMIRPKLRK